MKNDITFNGNVFGGRQGWAYICNSMNYPVLNVDLDKEHESDEYKTFDMVRILRKDGMCADGRLEVCEGRWEIGGWGCSIHSSFGFHDMSELIDRANRQIIKEGQIIALAFRSKTYKVATLNLFKVGKVDVHCTTIASLEPLNEEEMNQVKSDANAWCNRLWNS